ncbi:MAG TPA: hypothetical protein VM692_00505 [Gammaproteobacteria bacterium]|nr:hypothetical protein [Gammaproteobacteria bacterium]
MAGSVRRQAQCALALLWLGAHAAAGEWWAPGDGRPLPAEALYANPAGALGILNTAGAVETRNHPFFTALGTNGRACVTCHQPQDAMALSVATVRERWQATAGQDPLFAAIDGRNCPNLPSGDAAAHSLLLTRGLVRVALPWPPRDSAGSPLPVEFTLEVVRDPTGCNTDPVYGLTSAQPTVSVYRRPRPVANTKYLTHNNFGVGPFIAKSGLPAFRDPETGLPTSMNMMADARATTLKIQAADAARTHLELPQALTTDALQGIVGFESQIYAAQARDAAAGELTNGPPGFGPQNLAAAPAGVLGNNTSRFVFPLGLAWPAADGSGGGASAQDDGRAAIKRGHDVFMFRTFFIKDSMHLNSVGLGNPVKRTCSTCHGMHMTGMDVANGWMDIGTTNLPWAREAPLNPWTKETPQLPLFKVTCNADVAPHAFLGRVIYTQDLGRALISGKCNDVGAIVMQQFRGLAARAPYFSNGSAATLRELVDFYDRRYDIGYSEQEKQDLVAFLQAL